MTLPFHALTSILYSVNKTKILVCIKAGGLCMAAELADKVTRENRRGWTKQNIIGTVKDNNQILKLQINA